MLQFNRIFLLSFPKEPPSQFRERVVEGRIRCLELCAELKPGNENMQISLICLWIGEDLTLVFGLAGHRILGYFLG